MQLATQVIFGSEKVKKQFEELLVGKSEEQKLYKQLEEVFTQLEENGFSGIQIPKRLIPKEYQQKYSCKNLWKYNLSSGWRLVYSIEHQQDITVSIIIGWLDHKNMNVGLDIEREL